MSGRTPGPVARRDGIGESARGRTGRSRSPASSPTPSTCGTTACCGGRRCAARTRTRASARSTSPRRWRCPACTRSSPHEDVPGGKTYGLEHADQPVLAADVVRYQGEPVAIVAADHPETARRAAADRGRLRGCSSRSPTCRARRWTPTSRGCTRAATCSGTCGSHGDRRGRHAEADVVVEGDYEVGMQDQAFLGPESGLAIPAEDGGVDLYVATQWLHVDRAQVAASLGLPPEQVRHHARGVGGAFGGREDLSMQVHACMLALHTGRPVKMVYGREESFFGHVHRHPARLRYEHGADARREARLREGAHRARRRRVRVELHGGRAGNAGDHGPARTSARTRRSTRTSSTRTTRRAARCAASARCRPASPTRRRWTSSPRPLGLDPVELRQRNAMDEGDRAPDRPGDRRPGAGRRAARADRRDAAAAAARDGGDPTCASCPAASPTRPTARASGAASAMPSASRTSASRRASTTTRPRACGVAGRGRRAGGRGAHRRLRGRAGRDHRAGADRADGARRRARGRPSRGHRRRQRRLLVGVAPDTGSPAAR